MKKMQDCVEVLAIEEGLEYSRSKAKFASSEGKSGPLGGSKRDMVLVTYTDILDDDGALLSEWVHRTTVRPLQPASTPPLPLKAYSFGQEVDVWQIDKWWEGSVVHGRCISANGARVHTVRSTLHEDETIVENPAHIRLAMRWSEEGGWSARPAGWTASAVAAAGLPMRCPEDAGGGPSTAAAATHCAQTGPGSPGAAAGGTAPPPGRKVAPAEQRRLAANAAIDASGAAAAAACAAYLTDNLPVLGPFLAANDVARLQRAVAKASGARCSLELLDSLQLLEPAPTIRAELRPYQLEGLRWLATMRHQGVSCILADEMGLGKTLQTIALFAYLAARPEGLPAGPHLVVCPLSVLGSWMNEFARWCPSLRVVRLHTSDKGEAERVAKEVLSDPASFDVAVTTYDMALSDALEGPLRSKVHWHTLVLDEGHKVKNTETQITESLRKIKRAWAVLLTGTPLQNNMRELYALLNFLHPTVFSHSDPFDRAFDLTGGGTHTVDTDALGRAHFLLRIFWLRRTKGEVELNLPPKTELVVKCPLSAEQTRMYRALLVQDWAAIAAAEGSVASASAGAGAGAGAAAQEGAAAAAGPVTVDGATGGEGSGAAGPSAVKASPSVGARAGKVVLSQATRQLLNSLFMQLRKCCNHPLLLADPEQWPSVEQMVEHSGKLAVLDCLLDRLHTGGHRVVLFSQFTTVLDLLEEYMRQRGYQSCRLDGGTNRVQRGVNMRLFNDLSSPMFVFLLSTRAGGLGLNLQSADTCILYDSDWNPQVDAQAMARVHRIGQTRPVSVFRLITGGSVEERIFQRAQKKLFLDSVVTRGSSAAAQELDGLDGSALLAALRFGADGIFANDKGEAPSDAELDALCDRTAKGEELRAAFLEQNGARTAADFHSELEVAPLSSLLLQGRDHTEERAEAKKQRAHAERQLQLLDRGSRERLKTTVEVDGYTVLKANMYDMEEGVPSVFKSEATAKVSEAPARAKSQLAGRDFSHSAVCQLCWLPGGAGPAALVCCGSCPVAMHADCFEPGATVASLATVGIARFQCHHHACSACGRKTGAAGGLLFRCECCPYAYCEECLPQEHVVTDQCLRFEALGQLKPKTACFIACSEECLLFKTERGFGGLFVPKEEGDGQGSLGEQGAGGRKGDGPKRGSPTIGGAAADGAALGGAPPAKKKK